MILRLSTNDVLCQIVIKQSTLRKFLFLSFMPLTLSLTAVGQGISKSISQAKDSLDKTFQSTVVVSEKLRKMGLRTDGFYINQEPDSSYMVYIHFIFDKPLDLNVTVKAFDSKGHEYGKRVRNIYAADAGDAHYEEVGFENHPLIERKSKFTVEY